GRLNRALVMVPYQLSADIQPERIAQHLARARGSEGGSRNGRTLKSPLFWRRSHWLCSRMPTWQSGEGSIPVPLAPPARFGPPYYLAAKGPKARGFCRWIFVRENLAGGFRPLDRAWRMHFSLQPSFRLRQSSSRFAESQSRSGRFISNPSHSTEKTKPT